MRKLLTGVTVAATLGLSGCDQIQSYLPDYAKAFFSKSTLPKNVAAGSFKGQVKVVFVDPKGPDDRNVQLLEPFGYKDSKGVDWDVPAGYVSDGASIPWSLWTFIGGPYDGPYRDAAIIHDYYCTTKSRTWEDTHVMFLEASLRRGTTDSIAQTMYAGILYGGPRWPAPAVVKKAQFGLPFGAASTPNRSLPQTLHPSLRLAQVPGTPSTSPPAAGAKPTPGTPATVDPGITKREATKSEKQQFEELKVWIEQTKPTPEQIRKRIEEMRQAKGLSK